MTAATFKHHRWKTDSIAWAALAIVVGLLLARAGLFAIDMGHAAVYPFELDYGEGIVWQQVDMMFAGQGFGDITRYPFIVFHYPPVYHAVVRAIVAITGADTLLVGRLVSLASTLVAMGAIVWFVTRVDQAAHRPRALLCGIVAALTLALFPPVLLWAPLMRVDMLALALSLGGVAAGIAAFRRGAFVHLASLLFVLAVFTKQTSIAAPAAYYAVLLLHRPRLAIAGIGSAVAMGLAILVPLTIATDGGFVRHIFLYNINKFQLSRLYQMILGGLGPMFPLIMVTLWLTAKRAVGLWRSLADGERLTSLRAMLDQSVAERTFVVMLAYLATSALIVITVGKSGSSLNYFIEFICVLLVLFGIALRELPRPAGRSPIASDGHGLLIAIALVATILVTRTPFYSGRIDRLPSPERQSMLAEQIRAAPKPVLSDDMVILRRAGRQVPWESAIFEELTSTGAWDERPFVAMIRAGAFAFICTAGGRGSRLFDGRYTPAVADAIDAAYPVKKRFGYIVIHYPRDEGALQIGD